MVPRLPAITQPEPELAQTPTEITTSLLHQKDTVTKPEARAGA